MALKKNRRTNPPPFAKILRSLMLEKGISVRAAAEIAGVGTSTIDNWRAGAFPEDFMAVKRLAKNFGVTLSFILTGEEDLRSEVNVPSITEAFEDAGQLFDGYAKITIQRLIPRKKEK